MIAPGQSLSIGRKPAAAWVVNDKHLSGVHFEVAWDGARCEARDLGSAEGTLVGGQRVQAGEVPHGGWIRAGHTDFMVYFEGHTPPPVSDDEALLAAEEEDLAPLEAQWVRQNRERLTREAAELAAQREAALAKLQAACPEGGDARLYAVLDAARTDRILVLLRESVERYRSLYEGVDGESLEHVAPYLVELPAGSALLSRLVSEGWGARWGIFIETSRSFKEIRRHLRRFLMVADAETRQRYYFRFYDPAVLRGFLPTCSVKQHDEFFGDIRALLMEGEGREVQRFEREVA